MRRPRLSLVFCIVHRAPLFFAYNRNSFCVLCAHVGASSLIITNSVVARHDFLSVLFSAVWLLWWSFINTSHVCILCIISLNIAQSAYRRSILTRGLHADFILSRKHVSMFVLFTDNLTAVRYCLILKTSTILQYYCFYDE